MKGRWHVYSEEELAWIERWRHLPRRLLWMAFCVRFDRCGEVSESAFKSLCKRKGWMTGRTGCFVKGLAAPNKGKKCGPGVGGNHPNARRTQFKKGQVPHTYKGPGHEFVDKKDGYVILIVAEKNPWSGASTRPVHKHRWLWEKANGPIPKGMVLKCRDGNKQNTDPSNWELVPRGVLAILNRGRLGVDHDTAPAELKPAVLAMARLKHATGQRRRRAA